LRKSKRELKVKLIKILKVSNLSELITLLDNLIKSEFIKRETEIFNNFKDLNILFRKIIYDKQFTNEQTEEVNSLIEKIIKLVI
jgi:hypothetical protein